MIALNWYPLFLGVAMTASLLFLIWPSLSSFHRVSHWLFLVILVAVSYLGAKFTYISMYLIDESTSYLSVINGGGLVLLGGIVPGILLTLLVNRKYLKGFPWKRLVPAAALGFAIGRLGCFMAGCCYGQLILFPIQLVEMLGFLLFSIVLFAFHANTAFVLQLMYYCLFYGVFRFILEFYREDFHPSWHNLSLSQYGAMTLVIIGVMIYFMSKDMDKECI